MIVSLRNMNRVLEVNEELGQSPQAINEDPYGSGWLVRIRMDDPSEREALMDRWRARPASALGEAAE